MQMLFLLNIGTIMMTLIAYAFGKALPPTLLFYGLAYVALRKKMGSGSAIRSFASSVLTMILCATFIYFLSNIPQNPNDVAINEYVSLASIFGPFLISLIIVWVIHVGLARNKL